MRATFFDPERARADWSQRHNPSSAQYEKLSKLRYEYGHNCSYKMTYHGVMLLLIGDRGMIIQRNGKTTMNYKTT